MIFVTGDTHIPIDIHKLNTKNFPQQTELTKKDYVIILGDFGGVWDNSKEQEYWLNWLNNKSFTTLFIDGNHENFDMLNKLPTKDWHDGLVHVVRENILHLMRGYVFKIDGYNFFTLGGAYSVDKQCRKEGKSWWAEELPSQVEYARAIRNLEKHNYKVDYILTHTAPRDIVSRIFNFETNEAEQELIATLQFIDNHTQYKHWYFGHVHLDNGIDQKHTALYKQIIKIEA